MKLGRNRYNNLSAGDALTGFLVLLMTLAATAAIFYGYIMNIVALIHATGFSGMVVARAFGIIIPIIGVVLGYV